MKILTLVDFAHRLSVNFHARAPDGGTNDAGAATIQDLGDWRRGADHLIVACDAPPYLRTELFPAYKQGRARNESYIQIARWAKERMVKDGYSIAWSAGHEADDCIATLALALAPNFDEVHIISEDKDLLACLTDKVKLYVPVSRGEFEVRDVAWLHEKWGIFPDQVALFLAICGDKSDNIPGIAGIGEKGAAKLIKEFVTIPKMNLAAVKAHDDAQMNGAKKLSAFWVHFLEGQPRLHEWLALTTLKTNVPLDMPALLQKRAVTPLVEDGLEEHGDAWEPDSEELARERQFMDPSSVISSPKAAPGTARPVETTGTSAGVTATHAASGGTFGAKASVSSATGPVSNGEASSPKAKPPSPYKAPELWTAEERATVMAQPDARSRFPGLFTAAGPAAPTHHAPAQTIPPSNGTAPAAKPPRISDEITSIVVDRSEGPQNWNLALQPSTANEALQIAKVLFNSRLYSQFGSERGVFAIVMLGRELGLGVAQSLQGFFSVNDRPFASSAILRALVQRHPDCAYFVCTESGENTATFETRRRSWPEGMKSSYTYTWDRAVAAGLTTGKNSHNWMTKRSEMLEKTAAAKLARRDYSDATFGLHCESEIE